MSKDAAEVDSRLYEVAEGRYGSFVTLRNDTYISRSVQTYGEWCESEISLLRQILKPGDVVVDAGANIGTHTLAFADAVGPKGRVYAFEPQPVIHHALTANIVRNGASQAKAINIGLGREAGAVEFAEIDYEAQQNFGALTLAEAGRLASGAGGAPKIRIPVQTLDDALSLPHLKLIKSDIEGMEPDLLDGAAETLKRHRPFLYLECENAAAWPPVMEALERHGYEGYWHIAPLFNAKNWRGATEDIFRIACVNLFCAPKGQTVDGLKKAEGPDDHPRPVA